MWINPGSSGKFSNWAGGEPSDSGAGEDCGVIIGMNASSDYQGKWNDVPCQNRYPSLCERGKRFRNSLLFSWLFISPPKR